MDNFTRFQFAYLGKLPRSIMAIILEYYEYRKYLTMYYTDNGIEQYFVSANSQENAIRQFLMRIQRNQIDILLLLESMSDIDIDFDPEDEMEDENISDTNKKVDELLIKIMDQIPIEDSAEFIDNNFDGLIDLIIRFKDDLSFKIVLIE